jgi:hypothetical protein
VEQYAALMAACTTRPTKTATIRAQYGIYDDAAYAAVERLWRDRCARDNELCQRVNDLYHHYCAWYRQRSQST